ncbi:MAG: ABC transporter permease [Thermodesulfobacteriota bacterium]
MKSEAKKTNRSTVVPFKEASLAFELSDDGTLLLTLKGYWVKESLRPSIKELYARLDHKVKRLAFNTSGVADWDSALLVFLTNIERSSKDKNIEFDRSGLPEGVKRLLELAASVPEREETKEKAALPLLGKIGESATETGKATIEAVDFIGESFRAFIKVLTGRASYRKGDLFLTIQETGINALPIVTLISILVGLIFAFIASIQLKMFGAEIYIADLVGIATVRAMGSVMTGIIMSGRTGAAFAAQLGTMQVNEEIDAMRTMGVSPVEFLVMPRMLALVFMMPLLCLYADLMGIIGGMIVGVGILGLNPVEYYNHTSYAVGLNDLAIGVFMGAVFGVIIALSGCLRGMQCGRSASAVGVATTSSVVTSIIWCVIATAVITIVVTILGI